MCAIVINHFESMLPKCYFSVHEIHKFRVYVISESQGKVCIERIETDRYSFLY